MFTYRSVSPQKTWDLGYRLAGFLSGHELLALEGDLGTGKTVLARGIIQGLGIQDDITSPTFTIINEYHHLFPIYHMDLYRIQEGEELLELGLDEYLYSQGIKILEWPSVAQDLFPKDYLEISIKWASSAQRTLTFHPYGDRYQELVKEMIDHVGSRI